MTCWRTDYSVPAISSADPLSELDVDIHNTAEIDRVIAHTLRPVESIHYLPVTLTPDTLRAAFEKVEFSQNIARVTLRLCPAPSAATRAAFSTIARILPLAKKFFRSSASDPDARYAHMLNIVAVVWHANHHFCGLSQIFSGFRKRIEHCCHLFTSKCPLLILERAIDEKISARLSPASRSLPHIFRIGSYGVSFAASPVIFRAASAVFNREDRQSTTTTTIKKMVSPASRRLLNTNRASCDSVYCGGILPLASIIARNLLARRSRFSHPTQTLSPARRQRVKSAAARGTSATTHNADASFFEQYHGAKHQRHPRQHLVGDAKQRPQGVNTAQRIDHFS